MKGILYTGTDLTTQDENDKEEIVFFTPNFVMHL